MDWEAVWIRLWPKEIDQHILLAPDLEDYPSLLLEVRQKGLMMGLQYTNESIGPRMTKKLADRGVIAIYTGNDPSICRLMPSLVITPEEVDFVLNALADSMKELSGEAGLGKND